MSYESQPWSQDDWIEWAKEEIRMLSEARLGASTARRIAVYLESLPSDPERDALLGILEPYQPNRHDLGDSCPKPRFDNANQGENA